jgi:hypothetical protein
MEFRHNRIELYVAKHDNGIIVTRRLAGRVAIVVAPRPGFEQAFNAHCRVNPTGALKVPPSCHAVEDQ